MMDAVDREGFGDKPGLCWLETWKILANLGHGVSDLWPRSRADLHGGKQPRR
jgi:hypothetical protein